MHSFRGNLSILFEGVSEVPQKNLALCCLQCWYQPLFQSACQVAIVNSCSLHKHCNDNQQMIETKLCANVTGISQSNISIRLGKSNSTITIRSKWFLTKFSLSFRIRIGTEKNPHWGLLGAMGRWHKTCPQPRGVRAQAPTHPAQSILWIDCSNRPAKTMISRNKVLGQMY